MMKSAVIEKANGMLTLVSFDGSEMEITSVRGGRVWHHEQRFCNEETYEAAVRDQRRYAHCKPRGYDAI